MATEYLLKCHCGTTHPVGTSRAGQEIVCSCGVTVAIPTLRGLRELPSREVATPTTSESGWSTGHGLVALGLVGLVICLVGDWAVKRRLPAPPTFDTAGETLALDERLEAAGPLELWQYWTTSILPLKDTGLRRTATTEEIHYQAAAEQLWRYRLLVWSAAAVAGLVAVAGAAIMVAGR